MDCDDNVRAWNYNALTLRQISLRRSSVHASAKASEENAEQLAAKNAKYEDLHQKHETMKRENAEELDKKDRHHVQVGRSSLGSVSHVVCSRSSGHEGDDKGKSKYDNCLRNSRHDAAEQRTSPTPIWLENHTGRERS